VFSYNAGSWQSSELILGASAPVKRDTISPKPRQDVTATVIELLASSKSRLPSAFVVIIEAPAEKRAVMPAKKPVTGTTFCIADTASGLISCPIRTLSTIVFIFTIAIVAMEAIKNLLRLLLIR
jgi:hypothetical protein